MSSLFDGVTLVLLLTIDTPASARQMSVQGVPVISFYVFSADRSAERGFRAEEARMALKDVYDYFRNWDRESFEVVACQGNEPTEADIAAFEAVIGFRLPEEFREFTMSPLGGLYMAVREELWPRPKPYQVGPAWSFAYGLKVFGIAADIPDWLDIREEYRELVSGGLPGVGTVPADRERRESVLLRSHRPHCHLGS